MSRQSEFANKIHLARASNQGAQILIVALILSAAVLIYDRKDAIPMDLTPYQWKNRLLFLFAPDDSHPDFKLLQSNIAKQPSEVEDRDLVVFEIMGQGPSRINAVPLNQQAADSIRDHFGIVKNGFALILVGKDGGVKMKRVDQVRLADVFERIDSMPMRRNEMRLRKQ